MDLPDAVPQALDLVIHDVGYAALLQAAENPRVRVENPMANQIQRAVPVLVGRPPLRVGLGDLLLRELSGGIEVVVTRGAAHARAGERAAAGRVQGEGAAAERARVNPATCASAAMVSGTIGSKPPSIAMAMSPTADIISSLNSGVVD